MAFSNMQNTEHPEVVMAQQHNQTIMITASQTQGQQPSQTPPIQQVNGFFLNFTMPSIFKCVILCSAL